VGEVFEDFAEEVDGAGRDYRVAGFAEGALAGGGKNFRDDTGAHEAAKGGGHKTDEVGGRGRAGLRGREEDDFARVAGGDVEERAGAEFAECADEDNGRAARLREEAGEIFVEGARAFGVVRGVEDERAVVGEGKFLPARGPVDFGEGGGGRVGGNQQGFFEYARGEEGGGGVRALMRAGEARWGILGEVITENFADAVQRRRFFAGDGADDGFGFQGHAAHHDRDARLDDARFFARNFFEGVAKEFLMVEADRCDDAQLGRDDIGGVEAAAEADFDEREVHFFVGKMKEGSGSHELEEGRLVVGVVRGEGVGVRAEFGDVAANFSGS